jgi:hypothetical protein
MQDILASNNTIHATSAGDTVWVSKGCATPRRFGKPIDQFWSSRFCADVPEFRIIALPHNSALIRDAYAHAEASGARVLLAGPQLIRTRVERENPTAVLTRSIGLTHALFQLPPSVGGWHEMQRVEHPIYAAAAAYGGNESPDRAVEALAGQELTKRLQFIQPCDNAAIAQIVAAIRDPRWFASSQSPSKMRHLYNYMGFHPIKGDSHSNERRELVHSAWRTEAKVPSGVSRHPRGFLWRFYYKLAASGSKVQAELRTSLLLLRYLRSTWLDVLAQGLPHISEPLFVPEHFFEAAFTEKSVKDPYSVEIATAYKRYLADPVSAPAEGD